MNLLCFAIGVLIGGATGLCVCILRIAHMYAKPAGTFVMDFSDPLKDVCRLELSEALDIVYTKKYIILQVETYDAPSQE